MFPCLCCHQPSLTETPPGTYLICQVCGWEDDAAQAEDPSLEGGANRVSLAAAQANYERFGVSDPGPGR